MKIRIILICFFLLFNNLNADFTKGARPLGLSGSFVTIHNDIHAIYYNPAGISDINRYTLAFTYMPIYMVDNLFHVKIAGVFPITYPRIGVSYYNLSLTDTYSENELIVSLGYPLNKFISLGANVKYYSYSVELGENETSYDDRLSFLSLDTGFQASFIKWVTLGVSALNLNDPKIRYSDNSSNYSSKRVFLTGVRINFTDYFHISFDEEFKKNESMVLKFGSELWFYDTVAIRTGITKNGIYGIGFGVDTYYANLDFAVQSHPELGFQYMADLTGKF